MLQQKERRHNFSPINTSSSCAALQTAAAAAAADPCGASKTTFLFSELKDGTDLSHPLSLSPRWSCAAQWPHAVVDSVHLFTFKVRRQKKGFFKNKRQFKDTWRINRKKNIFIIHDATTVVNFLTNSSYKRSYFSGCFLPLLFLRQRQPETRTRCSKQNLVTNINEPTFASEVVLVFL